MVALPAVAAFSAGHEQERENIMTKRKTVQLFAAALAFVFASPAAARDMVVGSWLPPTHPMNAEVLPTWGKWISDATEGRVNLRIEYHAGHPKGVFDGVEDGAYDAGWSFHGYIPGRFKLTKIAELPLLNAGAEAASAAHWRVHQKYLAKAGEHEGLHLAALFTHGPGQIMMREPFSGIAGMKGKKVRVGGGIQGEIAKRMGVVVVPAPGSKVYEILSTGVADGVFMPVGEQKTLRLAEVAKYVYLLPEGMYLGSFGIFINPGFLQSLSEADRKGILENSGEKLSAMAGRVWAQNDKNGIAAARSAGNTIVEAPDSEKNAFRDMVRGIDEEWLKEVAPRGVEAEAALREFRREARSL